MAPRCGNESARGTKRNFRKVPRVCTPHHPAPGLVEPSFGRAVETQEATLGEPSGRFWAHPGA